MSRRRCVLKIRIYLGPSDGGKTRQVAHANIINTGMHPDHPEKGEYYIHFYHERKLVKTAHITDFPRLERSCWNLLAAAFQAENLAKEEAPDDPVG